MVGALVLLVLLLRLLLLCLLLGGDQGGVGCWLGAGCGGMGGEGGGVGWVGCEGDGGGVVSVLDEELSEVSPEHHVAMVGDRFAVSSTQAASVLLDFGEVQFDVDTTGVVDGSAGAPDQVVGGLVSQLEFDRECGGGWWRGARCGAAHACREEDVLGVDGGMDAAEQGEHCALQGGG